MRTTVGGFEKDGYISINNSLIYKYIIGIIYKI